MKPFTLTLYFFATSHTSMTMLVRSSTHAHRTHRQVSEIWECIAWTAWYKFSQLPVCIRSCCQWWKESQNMNSISTRAQWPSLGIICTFVCLPTWLLFKDSIYFAQSYVSLAKMLESSKIATKLRMELVLPLSSTLTDQNLHNWCTHRHTDYLTLLVHMCMGSYLTRWAKAPHIPQILNLSLPDRLFSS